MSTWRIRHEGSPRSIDNLTLQQVLEGLADGHWEGTDEVMGPSDRAWVAIESHPQFAEIAADLDPLPPKHYDDETRLDMTPLIDVCLVLLIFFIITTTYSILQKRLDAPNATSSQPEMAVVTDKEVKEQMIKVQVLMENNAPIFKIEDNVVKRDALEFELTAIGRSAHKTNLVLMHDDDAPHWAVVAVLDAARGAGMEKVRLVVPDKPK
jgi:biopolymer transport protein ExbD